MRNMSFALTTPQIMERRGACMDKLTARLLELAEPMLKHRPTHFERLRHAVLFGLGSGAYPVRSLLNALELVPAPTTDGLLGPMPDPYRNVDPELRRIIEEWSNSQPAPRPSLPLAPRVSPTSPAAAPPSQQRTSSRERGDRVAKAIVKAQAK